MEKGRFLQTLAGYKDSSSSHNIMEEAVRGSESVDSYKKDKEHGRVYLPPVSKEAQSKNIKDIYLNSNAGVRHSAVDGEKSPDAVQAQIVNARKNAEAKRRLKLLQGDDDKVGERGRSLKEDKPKYVKDGLTGAKVAYKVHNMNQDAEFKTNINSIKNIYGVKESGRPGIDLLSGKDPIHAMIKRHKNQVLNRSPSQEGSDYEVKKDTKLPSIGGVKYSKLPPLGGEERSLESTQSPKKNKIKEMSKAYKVNVGNPDEIQERYSVGKAAKNNKNPVARNYPNGLEYGVNGVKYGKGYNDF